MDKDEGADDESDEDEMPLDQLVARKEATEEEPSSSPDEGACGTEPGPATGIDDEQATAVGDARGGSDMKRGPATSQEASENETLLDNADRENDAADESSGRNDGREIESHRLLARMEGKEDAIRLFK